LLSYLPLAFLGIVTAFLCHELAHKYVAQRYGYWSEFRMYSQGLIYALIFALLIGFVFAAPGAVQVLGNPTREENGKMALAGPLTNIIISLTALSIWLLTPGFIGNLAFFIAYINAFLGFFNLLPIGPMDGMKIFSWRREIWIGALIVSIILLGILFF
jgi:Zn-dependent protease